MWAANLLTSLLRKCQGFAEWGCYFFYLGMVQPSSLMIHEEAYQTSCHAVSSAKPPPHLLGMLGQSGGIFEVALWRPLWWSHAFKKWAFQQKAINRVAGAGRNGIALDKGPDPLRHCCPSVQQVGDEDLCWLISLGPLSQGHHPYAEPAAKRPWTPVAEGSWPLIEFVTTI